MPSIPLTTLMLLTTFYVGQIPFVEASQNHRGMYVTGDTGHHHDSNNCVDVSRYSEVQHNVTRANICTHRKHRACTRKTAPACVSIPVVECAATPVVDCARVAFTAGTFRNDTTVTKRFVPHVCGRRGSRTIVKVHKTPVCRRVTKQQCETKWINDPATTGRKVWAGNENCQEVSREDCALAQTSKKFSLPVWSCQALAPIFYSVPTVREVKVTGYRRECTASVQPLCTTRMQQMCTDVEFEECSDTVERICYGCDDDDGSNNTNNPGCLEFRIPYQTHDHRSKCIGTFNS